MKKIYLILAAIVILIAFVWIESNENNIVQQWLNSNGEMEQHEELAEETVTVIEEEPVYVEEDRISLSQDEHLIGMSEAEVMERFGEPSRLDPSAYGYEWWIYPLSDQLGSYLQIGIANDQVVTVFMTGVLDEKSFSLGVTYDRLQDQLDFKEFVDVKTAKGDYQFELSKEDLKMRPLVKIEDTWFQFYFDTYTEEVSSIRMMTSDVLVAQRPYSVSYMGEAPKRPELTEEQWEIVEKGEARQIFDFTNTIRERHHLEPFLWEEDVSLVAYEHSKDMSIHSYFSHTSPTYGEISDRYERADIPYRLAGENIAAKYVDGIAAVEGWLNSEGHRVNLLHEEFTHLGVGVYQDFFTQNFYTPWPL